MERFFSQQNVGRYRSVGVNHLAAVRQEVEA